MQNGFPHNHDYFPELRIPALQKRVALFKKHHPIIRQIILHAYSSQYKKEYKYAVVLELHNFNPQKTPWQEYLSLREVQANAELEAEDLDGIEPLEHLKSVAISGLIFEAGTDIPQKEIYEVAPKVAFSEEWYFCERFPGEKLPEGILKAFSVSLFPADSAAEIQQKNVFRKEGPTWTIVYEGIKLRGLRGKGLEEIHYLIIHREKIFHTDELARQVDGQMPEMPYQEYDQRSDDTSRESQEKDFVDHRDIIFGESVEKMKEHYYYLKQEIREAENDNDLGRKDKAEKEFAEFNAHYSSYFGKNGRSRRFIDTSTKTKNRICKRIERALDSIKEEDEKTWRHLIRALAPINSFFHSYQPDRDINWLTE